LAEKVDKLVEGNQQCFLEVLETLLLKQAEQELEEKQVPN
jgi:hypothetical protein